MKKKYFISCLVLFLLAFLAQNCLTESKIKPESEMKDVKKSLNESFRKTGWISENKYRAVVFVITNEECEHSTDLEIEERIKNEAYKFLQKELNPSYNRNAFVQIKGLSDNFGKLIKADKDCVDGNIYFFDIEKKDLKADFEKIKNL